MSSVKVIDYSVHVLKKTEEAMKKTAQMLGMAIETNAKQLSPVDTGLLRNSITYAVGGQSPANPTYTDNSGAVIGHYEGTATNDSDGEVTVTVGTNVNYAPYQELGHFTVNGNWVAPQAFLRPAIQNNMNQIAQIIEQNLKP